VVGDQLPHRGRLPAAGQGDGPFEADDDDLTDAVQVVGRHRAEQAAGLIAQAAERYAADPEVQMLAAESKLVDRKDPQGAIAALNAVQLPADNRFMAFRKAGLLADAYEATGRKPEAAAALEAMLKVFPNARLQQRLDALRK